MSFLGSLIYGYRYVQSVGVLLAQRSYLNFKGTGVVVTDNAATGATDVTITAGGGGSTPTGTGLYHTVGGVMLPAASLIVNADVDPAANIALSKLAPATAGYVPIMNAGGTAWVGVALSGAITTDSTGLTAFASGAFGALNLSTTGYISLGSAPSVTAGQIRLTAAVNAKLVQIRYTGTDYDLIAVDSGAGLRFGTVSFPCQINAYNLVLNAASTALTGFARAIQVLAIGSAAADFLTFPAGSTSLALNQADATGAGGTGAPFTDHAQNQTGTTSTGGKRSIGGGTGTTSYGLTAITSPLDPGRLAYTFASDANQTLTPAQSANNILHINAGVTSVGRTITVSRLAANPGAMLVKNLNAQIITMQWLSGTGFAMAPNSSAWLTSDGTNMIAEMIGT